MVKDKSQHQDPNYNMVSTKKHGQQGVYKKKMEDLIRRSLLPHT